MTELIIYTGNIGCGKSFLSSKLAKKGYVIVNNDAITTMIQGSEYGLYDVNKKPIYREIEVAAIRTSLLNGFSVVVDRTNMKALDRKRYIDIGKEYKANIISFDWGPGDETTLARRLANPNGIPESQWRKVHRAMTKSYEKPSLDEGFNCLRDGITKYYFYAIDFDGTIVKDEWPMIGPVNERLVSHMENLWKRYKNIIIVWTCRSGDSLNQMKVFLLKNQIPFDFINENPLFELGSRKIFANEYWDDRNREVIK